MKLNVKTVEATKAKKLSLNTDKCKVLHIGKKMKCRANLKVHDSAMKSVDREKYLRQYISADGKNDRNIEDRCSRGIGIISQVHVLMTAISIGAYFFHIGLIMRETNLVNGILFGSEAWYGLTKNQIERLENTDLSFFRKLFLAHSKSAKESFLLETGKLPLSFILINRRLMYWHHIVNSKKEGLLFKFYTILFKFYTIQKSCPARNDWVTEIRNDMNKIGLDITDTEAQDMSKTRFKAMLRRKVTSAALKYLNDDLT